MNKLKKIVNQLEIAGQALMDGEIDPRQWAKIQEHVLRGNIRDIDKTLKRAKQKHKARRGR